MNDLDHHYHACDHENLQYFDDEYGDHYHNHQHHVDDLLMQDREGEEHTLEPDGVPGDLKNCSGISRISQYIPVYPGISWYIPEYPDISRYIPVYPNISRYVSVYPGISRYIKN